MIRIVFVGGQLAVDVMLDAEERDELHVWRVAQHVDRAHAVAIHAGRMGEQPDALAGERSEVFRREHVDAEHDRKNRLGPRGRGRRRR